MNLSLEFKIPFVLIKDDPHFMQIILPPNDLSEIKLPLPHLPHTLLLTNCIYDVNKIFPCFNYKLFEIM